MIQSRKLHGPAIEMKLKHILVFIKIVQRFNKIVFTSVFWNACSAVHSARDVGFERANTIGRSLNFAISWRISGVKSPGVAEAPIIIYKERILNGNGLL